MLTQFGIKAEPLRATTDILPENGDGVILGSDGDGVKRPAAKPGYWKGHLVSLVEDQYLIDTTLDQINSRRFCTVAKPVVIYLPDTNWWDQRWPEYHRTGRLSLFPGFTVRYQKFHGQNGWKSAGDFRPGRRKEIVEQLIEMNRWW